MTHVSNCAVSDATSLRGTHKVREHIFADEKTGQLRDNWEGYQRVVAGRAGLLDE